MKTLVFLRCLDQRESDRRRVDPKVIADQQGHTVDVNLNVYAQTPMESRREAVETLASAFVNWLNG